MINASNVRMDHVPTLEGARNYHEWARHMKMTLIGDGLWTFVTSNKDPNKDEEVGTWRPDSKDANSDTARRDFTVGNSRANAVIRRKLTTLTLMGIPDDLEYKARETWEHLRVKYDRVDAETRFSVRAHMIKIRLKDASDVERFLAEFTNCFQKLAGMGKPVDEEDRVFLVLQGIPDTGSWGFFKQHMHSRIADAAESSTPITFASLAERIQAEARRASGYKHPALPGPGSEFANVAEQNSGKSQRKACSNCGGRSHDKENCWQKGGGAEGQKPAWMVMRDAERANTESQKPAWMVMRDAERRASASSKTSSSKSAAKSPPSLAAVAAVPDDIDDYGSMPEFSCAGISEVAMALLPADAVLLDSGATSHIIRDRSLFWSYDTSRASSVKTANQGPACAREGGLSGDVTLPVRPCSSLASRLPPRSGSGVKSPVGWPPRQQGVPLFLRNVSSHHILVSRLQCRFLVHLSSHWDARAAST